MPKYKPSPTIISGAVDTSVILQARRSKMGYRAKRRKRDRKSIVMMGGPANLPKLIRG